MEALELERVASADVRPCADVGSCADTRHSCTIVNASGKTLDLSPRFDGNIGDAKDVIETNWKVAREEQKLIIGDTVLHDRVQLTSLTQNGPVNLTLVHEDLEAKKALVNTFLQSIGFADIDHVDASGFTSVMFAALNESSESCRLLLEDPAMTPKILQARTNAGETVVHYAAMASRPDCLRLILDDRRITPSLVHIKAKRGVTALDEAKAHGRTKSVRILQEYFSRTGAHDRP